jgi:hypothetical protein
MRSLVGSERALKASEASFLSIVTAQMVGDAQGKEITCLLAHVSILCRTKVQLATEFHNWPEKETK